VVQIALTPAEAALFGDEWAAVAEALRGAGREALVTGPPPRRSGDALDLEVSAALTLDPDMEARDLAEVLRQHVRRAQDGKTRVIAIYGPTGLLEKRVDVATAGA
jgi:hypothetical protein